MNRCTFFGRHLGQVENGTCNECGEVVQAADLEHGGLFRRKQGTGQMTDKKRPTASRIIGAIQTLIIIGLAWSLYVDNQARMADDLLLRETALSLRQTSYYLNDVCTVRHEAYVN